MTVASMQQLSMLSLTVDLAELRRIGAVRGFGADEGRMLHHALCETFGKGAVQPFRLMPGQSDVSRRATLYAYTSLAAAELAEAARTFAPPEFLRLFDLPSLSVKTMPSEWRTFRRLAFDVRIRPVRRLLRPLPAIDGESATIGKGAEVDAWLVDMLRVYGEKIPKEAAGIAAREEVYRNWLAERMTGAELDMANTRMVRLERRRTLRGHGTGKHCSEGPDAIFHGELSIADEAAFQRLLASGVGRHTAYGYGMLLLRPARG